MRDDETPPDSPLLMRALEENDREKVLDLVEDPVRRQVLHDLDPDEGPVELSELAERVANPHVRGASAVAQTGSPSGPNAAQTPADRVAIQLHHVHLPKLADFGLVEYDHREKTVVATPPE